MNYSNNQDSVALTYNSLIILVGPSGAGKSTFAQRNFSETMHVSTDECRRIICGTQLNQKISDDAFELFYTIIEKKLKNGYTVVADSTALKRKYRQKLVQLSEEHDFNTVLVLFDLPLHVCLKQDRSRHKYSVGEHVIKQQFQNLQKTKSQLDQEQYDKFVVFNSAQQIRNVHFRFTHALVERNDFGPFDIIGSVQGCSDELETLLTKLNYIRTMSGNFDHPERRKAVFTGDIFGEGNYNIQTFNIVYNMYKNNCAYYVPGDICHKLYNCLKKTNSHTEFDLKNTMIDFYHLSQREQGIFINQFFEMYENAPPYLILYDGSLVVSHAGILGKWIGQVNKRIRNFCLYGPDNNRDWTDQYNGKAYIVYGHEPTRSAIWRNKTMNINLGVALGGQLCALRYPEKQIVTVNANRVYVKKT